MDDGDHVANISTPRVVHIARMGGLLPDREYAYQVRSVGGLWSNVFQFRTFPASSVNRTTTLLITADVGWGSIPKPAILETQEGMYDMHIHAGDMAYDMTMNHSQYGDAFFNALSPISSKIPFQAAAGNHETDDHFCDFLSYRARLFNQNLTGSGMPHHSGQSRFLIFSQYILTPCIDR